MYRAPDPKPTSGDPSVPDLEGSFTARASGLLATEFALSGPAGAERGRLRPGRFDGRFVSEDLAATFEASGGGYRMVAGDETLLTATLRGRSLDALEIACGSRAYEARMSLFRNRAVAQRREDGVRTALVSGGFTGRRYEARFDAGGFCGYPIAGFLLWLLATERRRAYRRGGTM